jgi:hypothetical protein
MYTIPNPMGASISSHVPSALKRMLSSNFEARAVDILLGAATLMYQTPIILY